MIQKVHFVEAELTDFWRTIVDPAGIGMSEAIGRDLASYTGEPLEAVLRKMARGKDDFKELWHGAHVDLEDRNSIAAFYRDQFVEAYELANWHCGRETGIPPLNYARAAFVARHAGLVKALDFGSGIGTGALCLASVGCEVDCADVARDLLQFVGHRFSTRGLCTTLVDLGAGQTPRRNYYDVITAFDVLEHVPDQFQKLLELQSYLRPGGYLLVNLMNDSTDADRPMHVSSAEDRLSLIRRTGMRPVWGYYNGEMQALVKTRTARVRNYVGAWMDWMQDQRATRYETGR